VERTSQPGCAQDDTDKRNTYLVLAAAGTDDFLLFSRRVRTAYQGKTNRCTSSWLVIQRSFFCTHIGL